MIRIRRLIWETWNVTHIARHDVVPSEVEEVCQGDPVFSSTYGRRIRVVGPTENGRMLTVILAPEDDEGTFYPVTARSADSKERRNYQNQKSGE